MDQNSLSRKQVSVRHTFLAAPFGGRRSRAVIDRFWRVLPWLQLRAETSVGRVSDDLPRNLLEGWCPEGESWTEAARRVNPDEWSRIKRDFPLTKPAEQTAALALYAYTGLLPRNEDRQQSRRDVSSEPSSGTYDGAVDIVLTDAETGARQVAEVTTTLDPRYEKSSSALVKFESIVRQKYTGAISWTLSLDRGWEAEPLKSLAHLVARALNELDGTTLGVDDDAGLHPVVRGRQLGLTDPPIVYVSDRNAGATAFQGGYLDALSQYLASDTVIGDKIRKLERESKRHDATRRHLYIGVASTGRRGGLLPVSPSYFTWGTFTAPAPLDDLWLQGGTGEIYHWARERGWLFHRT